MPAQQVVDSIAEAEPMQSRVSADDLHWYALHTCVNQEKRVAIRLDQQGIEFYLPLYRTVRRRSDRRVTLSLPLFPGYLFVHISMQQRRKVIEIPRVVRLIGGGSTPRPVCDDEIEVLRQGLSGQVHAEPCRYLTKGRRVRVMDGPFQGLEGILAQRRQGSRLVVTLHAIQRSFAVEVGERDVEPI
jgi:transcription antitermination factor NusG